MKKLLLIALSAACGAAWAQTPAANPMPDGSRDMYAGLGVQSAPRYEGANGHRLAALPVLQVEWSNGVFVSGMRAGIHLSSAPTVEFGPLLSVLPGRDEAGSGRGMDGVGITEAFNGASEPVEKSLLASRARLDGLDHIGVRVQAGGFANFYLTPRWRLGASLLGGSGRERDGARLELGVQRLAAPFGERHRVSFSAGVTVVNRKDNQSYFGISDEEAARSRFAAYDAGGGLRDAHLGARWNWTLHPSWMLTSNLQAQRLLGSANRSPLAERSTNLTVSTAIAYRF